MAPRLGDEDGADDAALQSRRTKHHDDDDALARAPALGASPEMAVLRVAYAEPFRAAFREAIALLAPEDRTMLRLHLVDNLGIDRLAPMYGIHPGDGGPKACPGQGDRARKDPRALGAAHGPFGLGVHKPRRRDVERRQASLSFLDTQR